MRRVVITGMGAVTPVGNNVNEMWNNIKIGKNGIDFIKSINTDNLKVKVAGEVKDLDTSCIGREIRRMDKYCQYGMVAAHEAIEDSGIIGNIDPERIGVYVSSGIGGLNTLQNEIIKLYEKGPGRISPLFVPTMISNILAGYISIKYQAKGSCLSIVTACATSTHSIGEAYRHIKDGYSEAMIAGGAEASIVEIGVAGFTNMTALSTKNDPNCSSTPFDKERDGFVMGEGAGIMVLEEYEHAKARGAKIYGEIVGYGSTGDAYHITSPETTGNGASRAMNEAMKYANIKPSDIDYINAHGTSTHANDLFETMAIKSSFGDDAYKVPISSTKSMTGHLLGAAGAVEGIICVKAIQDNFVPPTINYKTPDEELDLDYVPNEGRECEVNYALSNSLGFGGHNGSLIFKKFID